MEDHEDQLRDNLFEAVTSWTLDQIEERFTHINWGKILSEVGKDILNGKIKPGTAVDQFYLNTIAKVLKGRFNKAIERAPGKAVLATDLSKFARIKNTRVLRALDPKDFELWTAYYLKQMGYRKVTVTAYSGDFGVDVYAETPRKKKMVVQCKNYAKPVGTPVLQQTLGAMWCVEADICCVAVAGRFAKNAVELERAHPGVIVLLDGAMMIQDLALKMKK